MTVLVLRHSSPDGCQTRTPPAPIHERSELRPEAEIGGSLPTKVSSDFDLQKRNRDAAAKDPHILIIR
jgi:hypothetical protein